jgi:hypothetical protein
MNKLRMAKKARAAGLTHFMATCPKHGLGIHYSASRRCAVCARVTKSPEAQAAYWARNKDEINRKRREKYQS